MIAADPGGFVSLHATSSEDEELDEDEEEDMPPFAQPAKTAPTAEEQVEGEQEEEEEGQEKEVEDEEQHGKGEQETRDETQQKEEQEDDEEEDKEEEECLFVLPASLEEALDDASPRESMKMGSRGDAEGWRKEVADVCWKESWEAYLAGAWSGFEGPSADEERLGCGAHRDWPSCGLGGIGSSSFPFCPPPTIVW